MTDTLRFNPPGTWPQAGRPYNHGVVPGDGRVLYMTGQVAWDAEGKVVGPGNCEIQVRKSFENVRNILAAVGGTLEDIVSMTIVFVNRDDLPTIQKARAEFLRPETGPASIMFQAAGLIVPELVVELIPVAVIPLDRFKEPAA